MDVQDVGSVWSLPRGEGGVREVHDETGETELMERGDDACRAGRPDGLTTQVLTDGAGFDTRGHRNPARVVSVEYEHA